MKLFNHLRWLIRRWRRAKVIYSRDGALYYVERFGSSRRYWLSVRKHPMSDKPADETKAIDGWFEDGLVIRRNDGEEYWREAFPFTFYEVKPGRRETVAMTDDLIVDYEMLPAL